MLNVFSSKTLKLMVEEVINHEIRFHSERYKEVNINEINYDTMLDNLIDETYITEEKIIDELVEELKYIGYELDEEKEIWIKI